MICFKHTEYMWFRMFFDRHYPLHRPNTRDHMLLEDFYRIWITLSAGFYPLIINL